MRSALAQVHNPYHRAMICAWMIGLETLERIEVMLVAIAARVDQDDLDDDLFRFRDSEGDE